MTIAPIATSFAITDSTDSAVKESANTDEEGSETAPVVHVKDVDGQTIVGDVIEDGVKHSFELTMDGMLMSIIVDGNPIIQLDKTGAWLGTTASLVKSLANGKVNFKHAGRSYYYVNAAKMTSGQMDKYSSIASGIVGALSGLVSGGAGWGFAIAGAIRDTKSSGHNYWYTVKIYCTKNYKYYAFKTYAYKNAERTSLAYTKTKYKTMY